MKTASNLTGPGNCRYEPTNDGERHDMATTTNPLRSRWGFHPCDYDLYLKLRRLHKWYWQTVYDFHRWHRWRRKEEQNRRGPEPRHCPVFVADVFWRKPMRTHGADGFKLYPKTILDHGVVALYHAARTPRPEPVECFDAEAVGLIERLHRQAAEYFG